MIGFILETVEQQQMGDFPIKLVETIPVAAAIIYVVVIFLRSIEKRDERLSMIQKEWTEALKEQAAITTTCIDRNTAAMIDIKSSIVQCRYNADEHS